MISCQPSPASRRAAAWPSPEVVPVTSAIECSMGISVVKGEGRVVRPREARASLLISNCSVIYWCDGDGQGVFNGMVQNGPKPRGRPRSFDETEAVERAIQVYWS